MSSDKLRGIRTSKDSHERLYKEPAHAHAERSRSRSESKTRKSATTRQRIMDEASKLMVERGNTTFQMSEVSRRCGMSKGALYYYFEDKDDLVNAIYEVETDDLVKAIDTVVRSSDTAVHALRGACNEFARRARGGTPLAMALVRELVISRADESTASDTRIAHIVNVVTQLLEQAKVEGVIKREVNAQLISVAVCGAFTFAAMGWGEKTDDDFASKLFDFVVRGIGT